MIVQIMILVIAPPTVPVTRNASNTILAILDAIPLRVNLNPSVTMNATAQRALAWMTPAEAEAAIRIVPSTIPASNGVQDLVPVWM